MAKGYWIGRVDVTNPDGYQSYVRAARAMFGECMTLAVAHAEAGIGVLDAVREVRPPFSPEHVVSEVPAPETRWSSEPCNGNMPTRSVLATMVGISRSSLRRTASWIISLSTSLRACGACSISRRRCKPANFAFRKSSMVTPAWIEG